MKKKKINRNIFDLGGMANTSGWNQIPLTGPSKTPLSFGQSFKLGLGNTGGTLANAGVTMFNSLINPSGNSTKVGNTLSGIGSMASAIPGVGGLLGAGLNAVGGIWNAAFGSNINEEFVAQTENEIKNQSNYYSNANNTSELLNDWNNLTLLSDVDRDDVGSDGWFSNKAKNKTKELNEGRRNANDRAQASLVNTNKTVQANQLNESLRNFTANGGPLNMRYSGVMSPFGSRFANGGDLNNGVIQINNGGTHEENPYEGIQMGIDPQGVPNLVEEGEVIFNDYVFSNRLKPSEEMKKKNKYKGNTFADIARNLQKESEERPNDPISKRGLEESMNRLTLLQENVRERNNKKTKSNRYDFGSYLRYAPVVGSTIGALQNIISKPDYSSIDTIMKAANDIGNYTPISYTPIGNYLTYRPFDRDYYINKLNAQSGATRNAIMNTTSPSRNAALLAADYNAQTKLGDLFRQAEEYNLAQRERVEGFNRQTNMVNSEMELKSALANQEAKLKSSSQRLSGIAQAMAMKDAIDNRRSSSLSANLTNLFDSLGNIGKEEFVKDMIRNNPALLYDWMGSYKGKKSKGGYLTIKKRK